MAAIGNKSPSSSTMSKIDAWFAKSHLPDMTRFTIEDAKRALEELEELVGEYVPK
jgi:hypothetical protein